MSARSEVFVTAAELGELLTSDVRVSLLDVRWTLAEPDGRDAYRRGHLPGAVYVSLDDELSDHTVAGRGRHPLPDGRTLQAAAHRWGLNEGVPVVVYDDWNRAGSARAWWVLTAAGVSDVRILDGGVAAWIASGGRLETGETVPAPGDVVLRHEDLYSGAVRRVWTAQQAGDNIGLLLDARAPERFRGDVEPVDPVAGHIPGAVNLPATSILAADGTLLPDAELVEVLTTARSAEGEVGAYCGSGVTAALAVAGLAAVGVDAALFPGSWSEWVSDAARPVMRG